MKSSYTPDKDHIKTSDPFYKLALLHKWDSLSPMFHTNTAMHQCVECLEMITGQHQFEKYVYKYSS